MPPLPKPCEIFTKPLEDKKEAEKKKPFVKR